MVGDGRSRAYDSPPSLPALPYSTHCLFQFRFARSLAHSLTLSDDLPSFLSLDFGFEVNLTPDSLAAQLQEARATADNSKREVKHAHTLTRHKRAHAHAHAHARARTHALRIRTHAGKKLRAQTRARQKANSHARARTHKQARTLRARAQTPA